MVNYPWRAEGGGGYTGLREQPRRSPTTHISMAVLPRVCICASVCDRVRVCVTRQVFVRVTEALQGTHGSLGTHGRERGAGIMYRDFPLHLAMVDLDQRSNGRLSPAGGRR